MNNPIVTTDPVAWLTSLESQSTLDSHVSLTQQLSDFFAMALQACVDKKESNTARAYQTAWGLFLQYLNNAEANRLPFDWQPLAMATQEGRHTVWEFRGYTAVLRLVTLSLFDGFTSWRKVEGDAKSTKSRRRRAVIILLSIALRDGIITQQQGQALGLKPYRKREYKHEKPLGRCLTSEEVRLLRWATTGARTDQKALRDGAILDLMLYAGLQRQEVVSLTTSNLIQDGGRWWLVLVGEGQKTRRVKVHDSLYQSLEAWAKSAGLTLGEGERPLFFNLYKGGKPTGKELDYSVIGRIVAEYGSIAGLAPRYGENCLSTLDLRLTCGRNAYDNGAPLHMIQALLGHADTKTTKRFIGAEEVETADTAVDYVRY